MILGYASSHEALHPEHEAQEDTSRTEREA